MISFLKSLKARIADRRGLSSSYKRVFDTPDGQRVLRHIARSGHLYRPTAQIAADGKVDPYQMAMNEGARRLALSIFRHINKDPVEAIEEGLTNENQQNTP